MKNEKKPELLNYSIEYFDTSVAEFIEDVSQENPEASERDCVIFALTALIHSVEKAYRVLEIDESESLKLLFDSMRIIQESNLYEGE